jgi:hypothetical protein
MVPQIIISGLERNKSEPESKVEFSHVHQTTSYTWQMILLGP